MTEFTTSLNIGCLHLIIENGLNLKLSIILSSKLILVPVSVPYGIDLQYPHSTDADCSWLHHTPKYNYSKFFYLLELPVSTWNTEICFCISAHLWSRAIRRFSRRTPGTSWRTGRAGRWRFRRRRRVWLSWRPAPCASSRRSASGCPPAPRSRSRCAAASSLCRHAHANHVHVPYSSRACTSHRLWQFGVATGSKVRWAVAGVRRVWAGAGPQRAAYRGGAYCAPRAQLVKNYITLEI